MYSETIPVDVGYCLVTPEAGFAFQPPRTVLSRRARPLGARSVQNCPAVNALERQLVEMPCPVTVSLRLEEEDGEPALSVDPRGTFIGGEELSEMLSLEPAERWRDPKKPVLQVSLPWFFVTDAAAMVSQIPPFLAPEMRRWPGTMVAGRYPVGIWPQSLTWAFEWDRADQPLTLKQGEPLCYFLFEFNAPDKRPNLVEAAMTPELEDYRRGMAEAAHFTEDVTEVWEMARARRPERLLVPRAEAEDA